MISLVIKAQHFEGIVKNKITNTPIQDAIVSLKTKSSNYQYTFSDIEGKFNFLVKESSDSILIEVKFLGYLPFKKKVSFKENIFLTIYLEENKEKLQEIIIESKRKVTVNKDTVNYNLSSFTDKTEISVEDILKKLPGIDINENGVIKFAGKEIEKILIEGDDLTSSNYKILSKNLDANLLKSVQILRNYDDNPLKKQIQKSEKVAINLLIRDNKKNVAFGFFNTGIGIEDSYNIKNTLGLINKKFKILNLNTFNTIGEKTIERISNTSSNNEFDLDKNEKTILESESKGLINNSISNFDKNETILNNSTGISITFNKRIKKEFQSRFLGSFNRDKIDFINEKHISFINNQNISTINENAKSIEIDKEFNVNLELSYFKNKTYITYLGEIVNYNNNLNEDLLFNANDNKIFLNKKENYTNHHLKFTHKLGNYSLLRNYFYYQQNIGKEYYNSHRGFYLEKERNNLSQIINKKTNNFGWKSEFLKKGNTHGFSTNTIVENEKESFINQIEDNENIIYNFTNHNTNFKFKTRANYFYEKNNRKKVISSVSNDIYYLKDFLNNKKFFNLQSYLFTYNIFNNRLGNFSLTYSLKPSLLNAENFYKGNIIRNYRISNYYNTNVEKVKNYSFNLGHNYQSFSKGLISFTTLSYSIFPKSVLVNTNFTEGYIENNYSFTERKTSLFFFQNQTSKYYSSLKTSFKIDNSLTRFISFYAVNNVFSKNINYGYSGELSGTTYFKSKLNFEFLFQLNKSWNVIESELAQNESFVTRLTGKYKINKKTTFTTDINNYVLNNNFYNLTHANLIYKPEKGKFDYKLIAHNIFKNNQIRNYQINQYETITNYTSIIPNYFMLVINFRF